MKTAPHQPRVSPSAYVHPSAVLVGRVVIRSGVFIGPHAVIRADEPGPDGRVQAIVIEEHANVQDCAVIHALGGTGVRIGARSSVAHAAVVHGPCRVGRGCFIGFHAVVFRAVLGDGAIIMHQALVEGVRVPPNRIVPPAAVVRSRDAVGGLVRTDPGMARFAKTVCRVNMRLAKQALKGR